MLYLNLSLIRRGTARYRELCREQGLGPMGEDIDECASMPDLCSHGLCINTMGSYRCSCDRGFVADQSRTNCDDVNECETVSVLLVMICEIYFYAFSR